MRRSLLAAIICILLITCSVLAVLYLNANNGMNAVKVYAATMDDNNRILNTDIQKAIDQGYEEKLTKLLGREQLVSLAKDQWKYSLAVNGERFKGFYIYPRTNDVTLVLTETHTNDKDLPENILNLGSLTGGDKTDKFHDHLEIKTTVPYKKVVESGLSFTKASYDFKGVPKGTIINVKLTEPLRERLGLEYSELEVILK